MFLLIIKFRLGYTLSNQIRSSVFGDGTTVPTNSVRDDLIRTLNITISIFIFSNPPFSFAWWGAECACLARRPFYIYFKTFTLYMNSNWILWDSPLIQTWSVWPFRGRSETSFVTFSCFDICESFTLNAIYIALPACSSITNFWILSQEAGQWDHYGRYRSSCHDHHQLRKKNHSFWELVTRIRSGLIPGNWATPQAINTVRPFFNSVCFTVRRLAESNGTKYFTVPK